VRKPRPGPGRATEFGQAPLEEQDADLLVVTGHEADLAADAGLVVAYDREDRLRSRYAGLIATPSAGQPLLFVLDRDGSPVHALVASCEDGAEMIEEVMRKLQSAAFLCPECNVPDPATAAMWDVIY
jgi:hypothetical protein